MMRVGTVLALGLFAGASGCSNLNQKLAVRPATERSNVAAEAQGDPSAVDPFHPPTESPVARLTRYFPGLPRPEKPGAAPTDHLRRGGFPAEPRDRSLEAVPRPEPREDSGTVIAAQPRRDREVNPARAETIASTGEAEETLPRLAGAVVAETEPEAGDASADDRDPPRAAPPKTAIQVIRSSRIAEAGPSTIRSYRRVPPPLPTVSTSRSPARTPAAREEPRTRPAARDESRQANSPAAAGERPVTGRPSTEAIKPEEPKRISPDGPPVATNESAAAEPVPSDARLSAASRSLDPPKPDDDVIPPARDMNATAVEAAPEAKTDAATDGPPAIVAPPSDRAEARPAGPETNPARTAPGAANGRDLSQAGRPRMMKVTPGRDALPADLPPVQFPPTYYGANAKKSVGAKSDADARPARWTWVPKIFQRG